MSRHRLTKVEEAAQLYRRLKAAEDHAESLERWLGKAVEGLSTDEANEYVRVTTEYDAQRADEAEAQDRRLAALDNKENSDDKQLV